MPASPVADPEFLPFKLDLVGQRVPWLRLDVRRWREAALLDERLLGEYASTSARHLKGVDGCRLPLALAQVADHDEPGAAVLCHVGRCGSTGARFRIGPVTGRANR